MSRPPRPLAPNLTYHVTARGNRRQPIVLDDADRRRVLLLLSEVVAERGWVVQTYCLMTNHLHLVVRTPEPDLSAGMWLLLGRTAKLFNDRHDREGHVFQGRFHAVVVRSERHHLVLHRYVANNPVTAGLCGSAGEYAWSAHPALVGDVEAPDFLDLGLEAFDGDRERYARFVADGDAPSLLADLLGDGSTPRIREAIAAGYSQLQVARALGTSQSTISRRLRE